MTKALAVSKRGLQLVITPFSLLERLLFGITCMGFCANPKDSEQALNCRKFCKSQSNLLLK